MLNPLRVLSQNHEANQEEVVSDIYEELKISRLDGDYQRFSKYYLPCHKGLVMYCLGMLKELELAENAASDTLIKFWNYPKIEEIRDVRTWLFVAAKNHCLNYLNKTQRRREIRKEIAVKLDRVQASEGESRLMAENISKIIRRTLNEKELHIWQLHQEGFNNQEIAARLEMKEKTVANLKAMSRKKLQQALKNQR